MSGIRSWCVVCSRSSFGSTVITANAGKDTTPELTVRRLLFQRGYRYRLHRSDLPGKPDVVFGARRKLIFIHGCFWHAHSCKKAHQPRTNKDYWSPKLRRNRERDARHLNELQAAGWEVLTIWECELNDINAVGEKLCSFLGHSRHLKPN
jgi:DNA mismatch endonuclease (patch repair protein)